MARGTLELLVHSLCLSLLFAHAQSVHQGFNIGINTLSIPNGITQDGETCPASTCSPYFRVCVDEACMETDHLTNTNYATFSTAIGTTKLPLYFNVAQFMTSQTISIKVLDYTTKMTIMDESFQVNGETIFNTRDTISKFLGNSLQTSLSVDVNYACAPDEDDPICSICSVTNPCKNGGICLASGASYTCKCNYDYSGETCETPKVPCSNGFKSKCAPNGQCKLSHAMATCVCNRGYRGETCEQTLSESGLLVLYDELNIQKAALADGSSCGADGCNIFYTVCIGYNDDAANPQCSIDKQQQTDWQQGMEVGTYKYKNYVGDSTPNPLYFPTSSIQSSKTYPVSVIMYNYNYKTEEKTLIQKLDGSFKGDQITKANPHHMTLNTPNYELKLTLSFQCDSSNSGYPCQTVADPCTGVFCLHYGQCVSGFCNCKEGFEGDVCQYEKKNPCDTKPCKNGGQCRQVGQSYKCTCIDPYTGENCESNLCDPNPCKNGGHCIPSGGKAQCMCTSGYKGATCDEEESGDTCDRSVCNNHGTCASSFGYQFCTCDTNYEGQYCDKPLPCANNPCKNGGMCTNNEYNKAECKCAKGFSGQYCENGGKKCTPGLCKNGGTCTEDPSNNSYKCNCTKGFEGKQCETPINYCESEPCKNGGTCKLDTSNEKGYKCDCTPGYVGDECDKHKKYCNDESCNKHGTCEEDWSNKGVICKCNNGYSGTTCDEKKYCTDEKCNGNGICKEDPANDTFTCTCNEGYTGPHCENEEKKDFCEPNPCENGGICKSDDVKGEAICKCQPGFAGDICSDKVNYCYNASCPVHSKCVENPERKTHNCVCNEGYSGEKCENKTGLREGYCLSLLFIQFNDNSSKRADGLYCDYIPDIALRQSACDPFFKVCITNTVEECMDTDYTENEDVADFNKTIGKKTKNPLRFTMKTMTENTDFRVTSTDHDSETVSDEIDRYKATRVTENLIDNWRPITFQHIEGILYTKCIIECCDTTKTGMNCDIDRGSESADKCIRVFLKHYENKLDKLENGRSCDNTIGFTKCDPIFKVCVDSECKDKVSQHEDKNDIYFGTPDAVIQNPLQYKAHSNAKVARLYVTILDDDILSNDVIMNANQTIDLSNKTGKVDFKTDNAKLSVDWQFTECNAPVICPEDMVVELDCKRSNEGSQTEYAVVTYKDDGKGICAGEKSTKTEDNPGNCAEKSENP